MKAVDHTGKKFGKWTAVELKGSRTGNAVWQCKCVCGTVKEISARSLVRGESKHCGCSSVVTSNKNHNWRGYEEIGANFWSTVKRGAKSRNIEFDITIQEAWKIFIKQKRKCALSGWDISFNTVRSLSDKRRRRRGNASLDRIDSSKGYNIENVQWVHKKVNIAKNKLSDEDFVALCNNVSQKFHIKALEEKPTICLSGAFDILHVGHTRMIQSAQYFGKVVIILNSDKWIYNQKGYVIMPFKDRKNVLLAVSGVHDVVSVDDSDGTVTEALRQIMPSVFGNGGVRTKENTPERQFCLEHEIKMVYGLGGTEREQISLDIKEKILNISNNFWKGKH